ncbi:hypothetical protein [Legionella sp. km772]|uniref:hypothetical protein n=1 Tax=Legionella sp. km772 TaxID=2498111 RepID=UPI000F8F13FA|nr:hypothetical protein [Legionella sp. km772]RUR06754.1 hypothetical protein ELY15_12895 [Legionella sp. km772]
MADKRFLDPEIARQKNSIEEQAISSKTGNPSFPQVLDNSSSSIDLVEPAQLQSEPPLLQARKVLYEHIKAIPIDGLNFFMHQEKTYKRELVDLMRRIDKQEIISAKTLLELMSEMANHHQSDGFQDLLQTIKETLAASSPSIENEHLLTPPSGP